jgi:hypothetical protein
MGANFGLLVMGLLTVALAAAADRPSHFDSLYGELLAKYRRPPAIVNGVRTVVFDFKSMSDDARMTNSLFAQIVRVFETTDVSRFKTPEDEKAFWINAYNFAAIKLVVENYPITSIRSRKVSTFKYPWTKTAVTVQGRKLSLKDIEKDALLKKFKDARIVFAVNCATVSCPDLPAEPFTGSRLNMQLDTLIRDFLQNETKGFSLDRQSGVLRLSWIFDKDGDLIRRDLGAIEQVVHRYLDPATCDWFDQHAKQVRVRHFDHDWTLNDTALAKHQPDLPGRNEGTRP